MSNRICQLLNIRYPLIQAGMVWCSGWKLASAVSKAGGLGVIGSGSMYPDVLDEHLRKCIDSGVRNFAVNLPLMYPQIEDHIKLILRHHVPIVFTSAGNPRTYTPLLKEAGITVVHVVSSKKFALKAEAAGADAIVAEGFEAGGHNGREETTTFCLVPDVVEVVSIPVIAAGGIADGRTMLAAMALGAEGVQIGSRFVASEESSAHPAFKQRVIDADEGDTRLTLKELTPVRLLNNPFYNEVIKAYEDHASVDTLRSILGRGRAKRGMFQGDLEEGELEIGQVSARIREIKPAAEIVDDIIQHYQKEKARLTEGRFEF